MIDTLLERSLLPDPVIRFGIRRLLAGRLRQEDPGSETARQQRLDRLVEQLRASPIALAVDAANSQHYEVPTEFFQHVLGRRLKYSSAFWPEGIPDTDLDDAEEFMLHLTAERAALADGQEILELGCGWGSLTLFMAERFPASRILAVSNSAGQRRHVLGEAARRGLGNVEVVTADVNDFEPSSPSGGFDRVVSVEMFEHVRNYQRLLERIGRWLTPDGRLFVHVFCHRRFAYPFEARGSSDWMARHFFTGGLMPSADLLPRFQGPVELEAQWLENGRHYQRTAEAWLERMDEHRAAILPILGRTYGTAEQGRWWNYWRVFFMACAELFGYREGREWMVAHYRFAAAS